jgi:hypothetical protein
MAKGCECRADVGPVMGRVVRDVQHRLPHWEPLLNVTRDAHVPNLSVEIIVG